VSYQRRRLLPPGPPNHRGDNVGASQGTEAVFVDLAAAEIQIANPSGSLLVFLQAKVGSTWYDVPLDLRLRDGNVDADANKKLILDTIPVFRSVGIIKHCPFDEVRLAWKEFQSGERADFNRADLVGK